MSETPTEQGFNAVLGPAVLEIDQAIISVQKSQENLGKEIERLVAGTILYLKMHCETKFSRFRNRIRVIC